VQSWQLLTERAFRSREDLVLENLADHPAEEMPERHDHDKNLIGTVRIELFAKSFILRVHHAVARRRCLRGTSAGYGSDFKRWLVLRTATLRI